MSIHEQGWTCIAPVCADAQDKSCSLAFCLVPSEGIVNADFVLSIVLPILYGDALDRTRVLITDQGIGLTRAVEKVIASGFYGRGQAVHRLCGWHAIYKRYEIALVHR